MFDPFTLAMIGAGVGAFTNKKDPLKGALIGAGLGYGGGLLAAPGTAAAGTTAAGTYLAYKALSGGAAGGLPKDFKQVKEGSDLADLQLHRLVG
jgi:hypothetical protein